MGALKTAMENHMTLRGYAPSTIKLYVICVQNLARRYGRSPLDLSTQEIEAFLLGLRHAGRSDSTVHVHYEAFKFFFAMHGKRQLVPTLRFRPRKRRLVHVPDRESLVRFLDSIPGLRLRTLFTLAYSSGLRVSELVALEVRDLDLARSLVRVRGGKGNKDRLTLLSARARPLLESYLRVYRPQGALFYRKGDPSLALTTNYVQKAFKALALAYPGMEDARVHTLRHCFATHLLEGGTSLFYIMHLLGHAHIGATLAYLHLGDLGSLGLSSPLDGACQGLGAAPRGELGLLASA